MLLEKDYFENLWTYENSRKLNNIFSVEVRKGDVYYRFEFFFKFPNEFKIEVYSQIIYTYDYIYEDTYEYKRFEYALTKLKFLIDYYSDGQAIETYLHEINFQDLLRHLKYLTQANEV